MAVQNAEIAAQFEQVADLLELEQQNPFRVRAYRLAARAIRGDATPMHERLARGEDLSELPAIGRDLAAKIAEIVETGRLALLAELGAETPQALAELLAVPGLGPKRVHALREGLGVEGPADLLRAARAGEVRALPGFGEKTERAIVKALERRRAAGHRVLRADAAPVAAELAEWLRGARGAREVAVCGSFRRHKETVGDLDLLVSAAARDAVGVGQRFVAFEDVERVLSHGETRATVVLRSGLQVDLRVVEPAAYGAAMQYLTGSKEHGVALRTLAARKGLKLNEYGLHRGAARVAGRTEQQVYRALGLRYVPPELREDRGELDAARAGKLPRLLALEDVRGDLHVHTRASDGRATAAEMAAAARARGYDYLAIADHTQAARVAHGLDPRRMRRHLARIAKLDGELPGFRLLRAAEVDILPDGTLDLPAELLAELDVCIGAVHSGFQLTRAKQTERILRAMDDPHLHVLAHPSGRLLGEREPYAVDLERLIAGAAERGCALELNVQPQRMDLPDVYCQAAREAGVKIALATDAHDVAQLGLMEAGVGYARRGWLEARDVLNTRRWPALEKLLRR